MLALMKSFSHLIQNAFLSKIELTITLQKKRKIPPFNSKKLPCASIILTFLLFKLFCLHFFVKSLVGCQIFMDVAVSAEVLNTPGLFSKILKTGPGGKNLN